LDDCAHAAEQASARTPQNLTFFDMTETPFIEPLPD
jgi:hypothetical protein